MTTFIINDLEFSLEGLISEQVYQLISDGRMTMEQFDEWLSIQRMNSYVDGSAEANYYNAIN